MKKSDLTDFTHRFDPQIDRVRHRISGLARNLRGRRDKREQSMKHTDQNATAAAAEVQAESDADDHRAGAPAELGGEG